MDEHQAIAPEAPARLEQPVPARRNPSAARVLVVAFQGGKQADGGVESLTQLLERYENVRVTVLSQAETAKTRRWRQAGCTVHVWPLRHKPGERPAGGAFGGLRRLWHHLAWNLRAAWLALDEDIEVAHVNDPHALWHVVAGLRLLGIPTLYNIRDTKPGFTPRDILKWRCAFRLTQAQIVLSQEMRTFWRRSLGVPGHGLTAIYSVVDFQRMRPVPAPERRELRQRLDLPRTFAAGYVASFSEKKAQLRFITEAGPRLTRMAPGIQVFFLGDFDPVADAYAAACAQAARALGLESRLVFKGYVDRMQEWYTALDAVIVATQNEGLARCMIESLACGTPVVSFDVCSAREILAEAGCGIVVSQGDYAGLVSALAALADNEAERADYGRRGATVARVKFDATANVTKYLATYAALAGAGAVL